MDDPLPNTPREVRIDAQIHAGEIQGGEVSAVRIEHAHGAIITGYSVEEVSRLVDQIRQSFTPRPFSGESPYLGLETFQERDAGRFFGRDRLVAGILEKIPGSRCIALAGPSGSGKSSLVRAGLLPALKGKHPRQATPIPESPGWLYAALRPGRQPLEALGRAVSSLTGGLQPLEDLRTKGLAGGSLLADWLETALGDDPRRRAVLLVDQFEEIFTQLPSQAESLRAAFLDLLVQAVSMPEGRTILILTLRSDFIANCAAYPELNALLNAGFLQVGAMSARELAEAIARPAIESGLIIEDELCRRVMNEMRDQPGGLPLMQFALHDLFTARQASGGLVRLTLDDYLARGGLGQALERYANRAFSQLNQKEQQLARWVFSGLVQPGRGAQDTARRARFEELAPAGVPLAEIEALIHKLADARLVTTEELEGEGGVRSVSLAHERLLEAWSWLDRLVDENRQAISLANQIADDARRWQDHGNDASYLYAGARLLAAQEAIRDGKLALGELGNEFIESAVQRREAEQRAARRRTQLLVIGLAAAAVVFAILGITSQFFRAQAENQAATAVYFQGAAENEAAFAGTQRAFALTAEDEAKKQRVAAEKSAREAERNESLAISRQLAARSAVELENSQELSLLLAAAGGTYTDTLEIRAALLNAITYRPKLKRILHLGEFEVERLYLSQDGSNLLAVGCEPDASLGSGAFGCAESIFRFWDTLKGKPISQEIKVAAESESPLKYDQSKSLLVLGVCDNPCAASRMLVYTLDRTPSGDIVPARKFELKGVYAGPIGSLAISPDGTRIVSGGCEPGSSEETGSALHSCINSAIYFWDAENGRKMGEILLSEAAGISQTRTINPWNIQDIQYTADGTRLVVAMSAWVGVFKLPDGKVQWYSQLDAESFPYISTAVDPENRTLAVFGCRYSEVSFTRYCNGYVETLDLNTGERLSIHDFAPLVHGVPTGAYLDGGSLRVASRCYTEPLEAPFCESDNVILWESSSPQRTNNLQSIRPLSGYTLSADGSILATGYKDHQVWLWGVESEWFSGQEISVPGKAVRGLAFSHDGNLFANSLGDQLLVWQPDEYAWRPWLILNPGSVVEYQQLRGTADAQIAGPLKSFSVPDQPPGETILKWGFYSTAFSPDGRYVAASGYDQSIFDGRIAVWDLAARSTVNMTLPLGMREVGGMVFSDDGSHLAAQEGDGSVYLWRIPSGDLVLEKAPLGSLLKLALSPTGEWVVGASGRSINLMGTDPAHERPTQQLTAPWEVSRLAFDPSGDYLVAFDIDGEAAIWDMSLPIPLAVQAPPGVNPRRDWLGRAGWFTFETRPLALRILGEQQVIPIPLDVEQPLVNAVIAPDGSQAAVNLGGTLSFWSLRLEDWIADACRIANRELTEEEWRTYVGAEIPYRQVCGTGVFP